MRKDSRIERQPTARPGGRRARTRNAVTRWRRIERRGSLRFAVLAVGSIRWSPGLLELLVEEMDIDDSIEELLGEPLKALPRRRYPEVMFG